VAGKPLRRAEALPHILKFDLIVMSPSFCSNCGIFNGTAPLSCSSCGMLLHAAELERLAANAQAAAASGDVAAARALWAKSLTLLPEDTVQFRSIAAKIAELDAQLAAETPKPQNAFGKTAAKLGPLGVLLWKFKTFALILLTKGKLLLLGLTKIGTLLSMFASLGLYWALYGWKFALGLVISIYIHEMGHVQALRRYGIAASAPMFIPGFGAFIRLRAAYLSPVQDARVGLAGPLYGLGTAAAALVVYLATGAKIWGAIAQFGATINLFNLIPIWQLDGARGFHSLTQKQRGIVLVAALGLWYATSEPMLFLIALGCGYRMFTKDAAQEPDSVCLQQFAVLLVALAGISVFAKGMFLRGN
jgi:Zn-dependent protease